MSRVVAVVLVALECPNRFPVLAVLLELFVAELNVHLVGYSVSHQQHKELQMYI
jgi:hypothetical protein